LVYLYSSRIEEFRIRSVNVNELAVRQIFRELFLPYWSSTVL